LTRPDVIFFNISKENIENLHRRHRQINYIYHLWFSNFIHYSLEARIPYREEDKFIFATEDAANIFSLGFNYIQLSQDSHFIPRYHMDNVSVSKLYNLTTSIMNQTFCICNWEVFKVKYMKDSNVDTENQGFADYRPKLKLIQRFEDLEALIKKYKEKL
jgi:hypothetical protein